MFELKLVINSDINNDVNAFMSIKKSEFDYFLIWSHPAYDWLEENATTICYKLLRWFITNIVPLGDVGKKYFKIIANKRTGFTKELWKLYNQLEKMNKEWTLKISSYLELVHLGYTGVIFDEKCPVDIVIKSMKE